MPQQTAGIFDTLKKKTAGPPHHIVWEALLYKIRCNPIYPLYGALPMPYVPVRVTRGALVAHRYTYAPPRPLNVFLKWSCWTCVRWCEIGGFQEQGQCLFIGLAIRSIFCLLLCFLSLFFSYGSVSWGWGLRTDRPLIALSQPCIAGLF